MRARPEGSSSPLMKAARPGLDARIVSLRRAAEGAAAAASLLLGFAASAHASGNVFANPPSRADRAGLIRAFDRAHPNRSHIRLVGFRVIGSDPSAAAFYLTTGPNGSYASGERELYHRIYGHTWVHVARFKNTSYSWNDAENLSPGFLWLVTSDGSGTWNNQSVDTSDSDGTSTTYQANASLTWNMSFNHGRPVLLESHEGDSFFALPTLTGQASASTTWSDGSQPNSSCSGAVSETNGIEQPNVSFAEYPSESPTPKALDFNLLLTGALSWPDSSDSNEFPGDDQFEVGARIPISLASGNGLFYGPGPQDLRASVHPTHGQSFSYPVDNSSPVVAGDINPPFQTSTSDDGSSTSHITTSLKLTGELHFTLVGLWMPLGLFGDPEPPQPSDGRVPPVL